MGFQKELIMNWKKEIDELRKREKLSEKMGGAEKLKKQKENNRLNIRERIKKLLDDKSFHESQVQSTQVLQCYPRSCNQVKLTA